TVAVAEPGDPVLAPPIGAGSGVIVREGGPGGPVGRVVLADGAPLALGQVGSPAPPVGVVKVGVGETPPLGAGGARHPWGDRPAGRPRAVSVHGRRGRPSPRFGRPGRACRGPARADAGRTSSPRAGRSAPISPPPRPGAPPPRWRAGWPRRL